MTQRANSVTPLDKDTLFSNCASTNQSEVRGPALYRYGICHELDALARHNDGKIVIINYRQIEMLL
jgi:hypothetical protein